jgi:hypothetical protein
LVEGPPKIMTKAAGKVNLGLFLFLIVLICEGFFCATSAGAHDWVETSQVGPFILRSDFQLQSETNLLKDLAELQRDLSAKLALPRPNEPIELYLFDNETNYRQFLKAHFPNIPYRRALYIKKNGPGLVMVHRGEHFRIDLRHETTHAMLHSVLPMVPLWLDEGLAEYFEQPANRRVYKNPYMNSLAWRARFWMMPKIEKLEKENDFAKLDENDYRDSFAWVHYMLHGSSTAQKELIGFLGDIRNHNPPGKLSYRLARNIPELNRQFASHLKNWKPKKTLPSVVTAKKSFWLF